MIELRPEAPDGAVARALFAEYLELVRERLGQAFEPTEDVFASAERFSVFLVLYEDDVAVACGGLCPQDGRTAEIKRMFVTARARRRGHGRRLLSALEAAARDAGHDRVLLYTTGVLTEARRLYAAAGYAPAGTRQVEGRTDLWLAKRLTG